MSEQMDVVIIGAGPAGMAAAVYAGRAGFKAVILEKTGLSGGQVLKTYDVDNYPGIPGISGFDLSTKMREHAEKFGMEVKAADVVEIINEGSNKIIRTDQDEYTSKTVIIAVGAEHARLGVPGEEELAGMGVSYCATCDGAFFRNKTVAVVGGGNVAVEDAIFLARFCQKVYLIHRRNELRAAKSLQNALFALPNVEVLWDRVVTEIKGREKVESLLIKNVKNESGEELQLQGVFVAVGNIPNTEVFKGLLDMDEKGYIRAGEDCETNVAGIFAAGDVRTKQLHQILTAAADGANAITSAERYISHKLA